MSTTRMNGPTPDAIAGCCVMCLMRAKQAHYDDLKPELEKAWRDSYADSNVIYFAWDPKYDKLLRPGPYRGIVGGVPSLGIIGPSTPGGEDGLCWDHLAGLDENDILRATLPRSTLEVATALPEGLRRRP